MIFLKVLVNFLLTIMAILGVMMGVGGTLSSIICLIGGVGAEGLWGLAGIPMGIFLYKTATDWRNKVKQNW